MIDRNLLERLAESSPARLSPDEWAAVISSGEVLREEDTGVAGKVRVLELGGTLLVQEQAPDKTVLVRRRPNMEDAMAFVEDRLQTYERMWDG